MWTKGMIGKYSWVFRVQSQHSAWDTVSPQRVDVLAQLKETQDGSGPTETVLLP